MTKNEEKEIIKQLEVYAKKFLSENFDDVPLVVPIKLNGRLKKVLGRFVIDRYYGGSEPRVIELSKDLIRYYDKETIISVLKHECIHYALFILGQPFDDSDRIFIDTCKKLGASLTKQIHFKGQIHIYTCDCGSEFKRLRKLNEEKYRCGECKSKLSFVETSMIQ